MSAWDHELMEWPERESMGLARVRSLGHVCGVDYCGRTERDLMLALCRSGVALPVAVVLCARVLEEVRFLMERRLPLASRSWSMVPVHVVEDDLWSSCRGEFALGFVTGSGLYGPDGDPVMGVDYVFSVLLSESWVRQAFSRLFPRVRGDEVCMAERGAVSLWADRQSVRVVGDMDLGRIPLGAPVELLPRASRHPAGWVLSHLIVSGGECSWPPARVFRCLEAESLREACVRAVEQRVRQSGEELTVSGLVRGIMEEGSLIALCEEGDLMLGCGGGYGEDAPSPGSVHVVQVVRAGRDQG